MSIVLDLTGKRFGNWEVLYRETNDHNGQARWECHCHGCGDRWVVSGHNLRSKKTKGCRNCAKKLPDGVASLRSLFREYRQSAKEKGRCFNLSLEQFRKLTSSVCHYCGTEPTQIWKRGQTNGHYVYNGIDRKKNNCGYTTVNSLPCCSTCNKAKRVMSYADFIEWIRRAYNWIQKNDM